MLLITAEMVKKKLETSENSSLENMELDRMINDMIVKIITFSLFLSFFVISSIYDFLTNFRLIL